jgi:hypothetical protein
VPVVVPPPATPESSTTQPSTEPQS